MANGKRATVYFPHKKMVRTLPATWYFVTSKNGTLFTVREKAEMRGFTFSIFTFNKKLFSEVDKSLQQYNTALKTSGRRDHA